VLVVLVVDFELVVEVELVVDGVVVLVVDVCWVVVEAGVELVVVADELLCVVARDEVVARDDVVRAEVVCEFDELDELVEEVDRTAYAATAATPTMMITITAIMRGAIALLFCNTDRPSRFSLYKHPSTGRRLLDIDSNCFGGHDPNLASLSLTTELTYQLPILNRLLDSTIWSSSR